MTNFEYSSLISPFPPDGSYPACSKSKMLSTYQSQNSNNSNNYTKQKQMNIVKIATGTK
jgi:hypothetical protein